MGSATRLSTTLTYQYNQTVFIPLQTFKLFIYIGFMSVNPSLSGMTNNTGFHVVVITSDAVDDFLLDDRPSSRSPLGSWLSATLSQFLIAELSILSQQAPSIRSVLSPELPMLSSFGIPHKHRVSDMRNT